MDQMLQFLVKTSAVVDDPEMGMAGPGIDELVIHGSRLFGCFDPCPVVRGSVEFDGTLRSCHEMIDRVIAVKELDFVLADLSKDGRKFDVIHIDFVVQCAAVADDQDLIVRHSERSFPEKTFFFELKRHLALLVVQVAAAGPGSDAACDEFRGCFRDNEDPPSLFREIILNPADRSRFAAAGAAGDHNLPNILFHVSDPFIDR